MAHPDRKREFMRHLVGADAGELAGPGDERCDAPRPPDCPPDVACPFHAYPVLSQQP